MNDLINRWFSRAGRLAGTMAYGLRYADGRAFSNCWETRLSETVLNELWNRLAPMAEVAASSEAPRVMRWNFQGAAVIGAARSDGAMFFVLSANKPDEPDHSAVTRLLSEFRALRSAAA